MSNIYNSKRARRGLRRRNWQARTPLRYVLIGGIGGLLVLIASVAVAAVLLHGRGTLIAPAAKFQDLQVGEVRLSRPLMPGNTSDLLFSVRNPNAFGVTVDQVSLIGSLRKASPAGCTSKVTGPVIKAGGYRLPRADQVLVGAGAKKNVVVHAAFSLAGSAKSGCGFTAEVDVSATQLAPAASPTTVAPASTPTSRKTAFPGHPISEGPPTTVATTEATKDLPTSGPATPPMPGSDCDPAEPTCEKLPVS